MPFDNITTHLTINGESIKIHAFSTGEVAVKTKFQQAKNSGLRAILDVLFDTEFTDWLPIWVWVIEHPQGIFIIDSGASAQITQSDYFKPAGFLASWFNRKLFKFRINEEQAIDAQLQRLAIDKSAITVLILTHLHIDHTDGLCHFPDTRIMVSQIEWQKPYGHLAKLFPHWFKPDLIELNQNYDCFDKAYSLSVGHDLIALHTPGHTHGCISILLKTDQCDLLFIGDVCYEQSQIRQNQFSGANVDGNKAAQSYQKILQLAKTHRLVILPSHDKEAGHRLKQNEIR